MRRVTVQEVLDDMCKKMSELDPNNRATIKFSCQTIVAAMIYLTAQGDVIVVKDDIPEIERFERIKNLLKTM